MADPRLGNSVFDTSYRRYTLGVDMHGPFHRARNPTTQTLAHDTRQLNSGMLWGRIPRGGTCPTAQAYFGTLPAGTSGIQFVTPVMPHQMGLPPGFGANWYFDHTAFTGLIRKDDEDFAVITIIVTLHVP